jgi:hypothetical protein
VSGITVPGGQRGTWHYIPGQLYPYEATALLARTPAFHSAGLVLNQVPVNDVFIRNRVLLGRRKFAALGPTYKEDGADVGSD